MALITGGPAVGQISGRIGGQVFSRNRYGAYIRTGTKPVVSTTAEAMLAKARLGNISAQWQALTDAQRAGWKAWAQENPVLNRLGQSIILTGHAAYVQINSRLNRAGDSGLTLPPISPAPEPLLTFVLNLDIGIGAFDATFTTTPMAAGVRLWLTGAVVDSAGINYIRNITKLFSVTAAAQASPYDFETDIEARFGSLQVGQKIIVFGHTFDGATGLLASGLRAEGLVVST